MEFAREEFGNLVPSDLIRIEDQYVGGIIETRILQRGVCGYQLLVQEEPVVAMLSHSTKGSAKHPDVDFPARYPKFHGFPRPCPDIPYTECNGHGIRTGTFWLRHQP